MSGFEKEYCLFRVRDVRGNILDFYAGSSFLGRSGFFCLLEENRIKINTVFWKEY